MKKKIAVITGATSGIGEASSYVLADDYIIILVGRNSNRGEEIQKSILSKGGECIFYKCDITNIDEIRALAEYIDQKYGRVDLLFNNAGVMLESKEIERLPIDEWKQTFDVNINSVFYMTAALKALIYKGKGCIINNGSIAGMHSYVTGRSYAYSATKAAIIQFTRQMAKNYASDGVRVNCICPGIIDTPILGDRDRKIYSERIPLGYVGRPVDVANLVKYLASDEASYITGAVITVDGGVSL